ncbi:helix-turn-helix transcriptional regulator [Streptomyces sp. NPDC093801]|uniref:helix-turn-helix transcriptional regulator n=1 Tax=Streptomyces sp. NPDC093801 TaxID=3155203 RepID=UPI003450FF3A
MLGPLGLSAAAEAVYRELLAHPLFGVAELSGQLELSEDAVREALDQLFELALIRRSSADESPMRAISPDLGLMKLLARRQAELAEQQQHVEQSRAATAELIAQYAQHDTMSMGAGIRYLRGIDAIRDHLEALNDNVKEEFLTFAPGGPQTPANMEASRPLNRRLLSRGITMRTVYLDSIRRDAPTAGHAAWLTEQGAHIRTVPTLPNRMIIIDRRSALIASDSDSTADGALAITDPGVISLMCRLFDLVWDSAEPFGAAPQRSSGELTRQQTEVVRLMAEGRTDESIANSMGISTRTARRLTTGLLTHLGARSRFQAGVRAVQLGYLPSHP